MNRMKSDTKSFVPADKTSNFYQMEPKQYTDLLEKKITKSYKRSTDATARKIQREDKKITTKLEINDRVDITAKREAFITLKDHKPNFADKPTCRLINPTKSEVGKISKQILDRVNAKVIAATAINQWKNTLSVIDRFKKIDNKKQQSFICFDIVEFYLSISEELLSKALDIASAYDIITAEKRNIVIQAKKSLLTHKQQSWEKKSASIFDVTMGSFDGAETCELVGCFLLSKLKTKCGGKIGLYRDDGYRNSTELSSGV